MENKKSYRIVYEVHCKLENFFGKEMIVKNCYSELHAKVKLNDFCIKHYGNEFEFMKVISVKSDETFSDIFDMFNEKTTKSKDKSFMEGFYDILKKYKK